MILVTGSSGFIGKHVARALYRSGHTVTEAAGDDLEEEVTAVVHLAAITDTRSDDIAGLWQNNVLWPLEIFSRCAERGIRFIWASSASVYGNGDGPLTPYALSKAAFDLTFMNHLSKTKFGWYGLRLFNVYGPGEDEKGDAMSMVSKVVRMGQREFYDLSARRDFIHVHDVVNVIRYFLLRPPDQCGIYDVGSGVPRSIWEIGQIVGVPLHEIGVPPNLKRQLQTKTKANLEALRTAGYTAAFRSLEDGIKNGY